MKKNIELADVTAKDFVIFRSGTWNNVTFTDADLDKMAESFNESEPPHIILGHSIDYKGKTLIPSFGRIWGGLKRVGSDLVACGAKFNEEMAKWITEGFLTDRSIEMTSDRRILAVGMLGAMPPAVKGMPILKEALSETALAFSSLGKVQSIQFAEAEPIELTATDEVEAAGTSDTFKNLSQWCAQFLKNIDTLLTEKADGDRLMNEVRELQSDLCNELNLHNQFIKKIEQIEESGNSEMSERHGWKEFKETIKNTFTKRKEIAVDEIKEKSYTERIALLESQLKEFADKEAKQKADAEAVAKEQADKDALAADEAIKTEIKTFCETAIKENRMTPAMQEIDEPIMFNLAKTNADALKSFREKYFVPVVPVGEVKGFSEVADSDKKHHIINQAESYVKEYRTEFAKMTDVDAVNRALYLQSQGKIKFK